METARGLRKTQKTIFRVAKENLWLKFWDVGLECGQDGSKSSMALLKALGLRDQQCPVSNCAHTVPQDSPLCDHCLSHTDVNPSVTPAFVTDNIISSTSNPEHFLTLIPFGLSLLKVLMVNILFLCHHSSLYGVIVIF